MDGGKPKQKHDDLFVGMTPAILCRLVIVIVHDPEMTHKNGCQEAVVAYQKILCPRLLLSEEVCASEAI
jgi:hypothetical protein